MQDLSLGKIIHLNFLTLPRCEWVPVLKGNFPATDWHPVLGGWEQTCTHTNTFTDKLKQNCKLWLRTKKLKPCNLPNMYISILQINKEVVITDRRHFRIVTDPHDNSILGLCVERKFYLTVSALEFLLIEADVTITRKFRWQRNVYFCKETIKDKNGRAQMHMWPVTTRSMLI